MSDEQSLERAMLSSIGAPSADLIGQAGDLVLSQSLEEGVLQDVPVFGTLMKLYRLGLGVRDYHFLRKVARFLECLEDVSEGERDDFIERLSDSERHQPIAEAVLTLLERAEDLRKAGLLAFALKALIRGRIDRETFHGLVVAIDRAFVDDLSQLPVLREDSRIRPEVGVRLFATGLVLQLAAKSPGGPGGLDHWGLTELGETFTDVILPSENKSQGS